MPQARPATSGYARIAQAEEEEYLEDSDQDDLGQTPTTASISNSPYIPIQPERRNRIQLQRAETAPFSNGPKIRPRGHNRARSNSGVDIKAINARLEKWAEEIAQKFKIRRVKGKTQEEERLEIHHSVFQAPDDIRPATKEMLSSAFAYEGTKKAQFEIIVEKVKVAIELGIHPKMISQGSSGSYFARNSDGKVVGIFKPKDEEPYASRNPKWTKWIHRNLFPFFFGRACLIPNLSYVSEAAAYVLDQRLLTNIVPYTDIVSFSSIAFNHDFWDRRAYYRKRKALPQKLGSFQAFLEGFDDASVFLKRHPWPDQHGSHSHSQSPSKRRTRRWAEDCRPGPSEVSSDDEDPSNASRSESQGQNGFWSSALKQSFREQLEKLVILDYIMRNTDRGLDNWMIRVDEVNEEATILAKMSQEPGNTEYASSWNTSLIEGRSDPYQRETPMTVSSGEISPSKLPPKLSVSLGAIDNSLSWPWKHPDAWRSYPFGWLFLPVSLIGQPFSEETRHHFLPLLTSKQWWSDTQVALRRCFEQDSDFQERMFARQIAVMKGQAWNVVETLKTAEHGPLELTRRARVCVWDDLVDIPTVVPLRPSSSEMRRRRVEESTKSDIHCEEEMDISAARTQPSDHHGPILQIPSPIADFPSPNRFDLTRQSISDIHQASETGYQNSEISSPKASGSREFSHDNQELNKSIIKSLPSQKSNIQVSQDGSRQTYKPQNERTRRRNISFSMRRVNSGSFYEYGDDLEGDLGYAAAEVMECNSRKVIVERLENVKGKNPFFTWC